MGSITEFFSRVIYFSTKKDFFSFLKCEILTFIFRIFRIRYVGTYLINFIKVFHVAYIVIKFANSPRAGRWVLERSLDGEHFTPWQYFANHPSECERLFGTQPLGSQDILDFDDEVRCTKDFSEIPPLENGEVIVSLIKGRPGSTNFWSAPTLQAWTKDSFYKKT